MTYRLPISDGEYIDLTTGLGSPGFCTSCGLLEEYAQCEPDAQNYQCPNCEHKTLHGLEQVLIMGLIDFH